MNKERQGINLFKTLGDETRFKIVNILLDGEKCACEIPSLVKRAQPTVSLQLKYLVKEGIISSRKEGQKRIFNIKNQKIKKIIKLSKGVENK